MNLMWTTWVGIGSIMGALAVMMGAFGSHALRSRLDEHMLDVFEIAVRYQMYHAFALMAVALLTSRLEATPFALAGWAFLLGTVLFSGSLYTLVFTEIRALGMITPIGGVFLILGWILLAYGAFA